MTMNRRRGIQHRDGTIWEFTHHKAKGDGFVSPQGTFISAEEFEWGVLQGFINTALGKPLATNGGRAHSDWRGVSIQG